jgi:hypothetical protein
MSTAPGVLVEFRGACPVWTSATRAFAACCATGLLTWAALHHLNGRDASMAWLATGLTAASLAAMVWMLCQPVPQGRLVWNTQDWIWHASESPCAQSLEPGRSGLARIALDLGDWVLLRFDNHVTTAGETPIWLPLTRARAGGNWHALHCALRQPAVAIDASSTDVSPRVP